MDKSINQFILSNEATTPNTSDKHWRAIGGANTDVVKDAQRLKTASRAETEKGQVK